MNIKQLPVHLKNRFMQLSRVKKIIAVVIVVVIVYFGYKHFFGSKKEIVRYQTEKVQRGTLVVSVSGSGQISTANSTPIDTQASGVISKLYVKDGDMVKTGDKIADLTLDLIGQQKAAAAYASYQSANNTLATAQSNMYSLQSTMFTKWKTFYDLATNNTYQNGDGTPNNDNRALPAFHEAQDDWLAAEANYKNQQNVVNQAQTALNSAWLSYQQAAPTIYAPITGKVDGLAFQLGAVIASPQSTSGTSNSVPLTTKIASIVTDATPTVTVNLTEIDIPTIKIGNNATITLSAFPDKTFTGKVFSIDTAGVVSSGVTTYPTIIKLDTNNPNILPNMSANINIITIVKNNVLLVPSSAIQTQNGASIVSVMKNGQPQQVEVQTGSSSDTQTEITSGLSEGDTIVTSAVNGAAQNNTSSPFSTFGGGKGGAGGAVFRMAH